MSPEITGTLRPPRLTAAPSNPAVGQLYANTGDGVLYYWNGSAWVTSGPGAQGPKGDPGATGATGTAGTAGAPGSIWRSGSGAPAGALGVVGDWYENDANGDIYEKTGASTYTLRDNLTGPQGAAGSGATDATTSAKGVVQLAGDLAGTAASPQIAAGVVVDADVNASAAIAESKLALATDAASGTGSRRTLGTGAQQAAPGNDARFGGSGISYGASPPASPVDGQLWIYPADTTAGVMWMLRYRSASASTYKWEFVGGPPLMFSFTGAPTVINTMTQAGATGFYFPLLAGSVFQTTRAGDYVFSGSCRFDPNGTPGTYVQVTPFAGTAAGGLIGQSGWTTGATYFLTASFTEALVAGIAAGVNTGVAVTSGVPGTTRVSYLNGAVRPLRVI